MKIALVGYGLMGQKVKELAELRGHQVIFIIDPINPAASHKNINTVNLESIDLILDFSTGSAVVENLKAAAAASKNILIGATGWYEHLTVIEKISEENKIGILWSANFSIGVNLFYRIVTEAAKLVNQHLQYDVWGTELHHFNKVDSPSGTAKEIAKILIENINHKTKIVYDKLDRKIEPEEIHFSSTRGGPVNFSHTIGFDSSSDTITLNHSARDRNGYAEGAILAAEWLADKKGLFNMNDFLNK